ncbi:hypothetical protein, partial [Klebsiella variicola]|uniref:hypothetical protein n=1 Tax=Klebsiella variicola TaxID=244366 RepID=UPI00193F4833
PQNCNNFEYTIAAIVGRRLTKCKNNCCTLCAVLAGDKNRDPGVDLNVTIKLAFCVKTGHL